MKITEAFPDLLQIIYNNCNNMLFVNIIIEDEFVEIKGKVIDYKQQSNTRIDISVEMFGKCYTYLISAGFILEKSVSPGSHDNRQIQLTHKAINFIENYSLEGKA